MSKLRLLSLWLLVSAALTACATTQPFVSEGEGCETSARLLPPEEACEEEGSLLAVCGTEACAVYRCREVAAELMAGQVVPTKHGGFARPPGEAMRYWGTAQGLPKNSQPVFIIPWGPQPQPELLPSQKQLLAEPKEQRTKVYEMHHIFPRELEEWFKEKGIDIDLYTMPLEVEEHRRIHRGERGGPWNAAWRKYQLENLGASKPEIMKYAGQLIYEFRLNGMIVPYRSRVLPPPPGKGN
jgi:uncharacterized lipoprotein (TIGR02269 family)